MRVRARVACALVLAWLGLSNLRQFAQVRCLDSGNDTGNSARILRPWVIPFGSGF